MPDLAIPGVFLLTAVIAAVVVGPLVIRRIRKGVRRSHYNIHGMGRDDTVSYFRDFSGNAKAPGVREEDRTARWGEGDGGPR